MPIPKKHYLLVDGYNVINSWEDLKQLQLISLDEARELLIDKMSELSHITGENIIVVFDSYLKKNAIRQVEHRKGIEIVFTEEYETADNYIESLVANAEKNEVFKVASSDAIIQSIVLGKGATRLSSKELYLYYINEKARAIKRNSRKDSKKTRNIVSLDQDTIKKIESLERKMRKKNGR